MNVRVTPEERAEYDRVRKSGVSADMALLTVLQSRFSDVPPFVRMPSPDNIEISSSRERVAGAQVSVPLDHPATRQAVKRLLPKGFKPDFKGGKT